MVVWLLWKRMMVEAARKNAQPSVEMDLVSIFTANTYASWVMQPMLFCFET